MAKKYNLKVRDDKSNEIVAIKDADNLDKLITYAENNYSGKWWIIEDENGTPCVGSDDDIISDSAWSSIDPFDLNW